MRLWRKILMISACLPLGHASEPAERDPCPAPMELQYKQEGVIRKEPAFTQGLLFHEGAIYESSGLYGHSRLYRIDPRSGRSTVLGSLPEDFFGEGIAVFNEELVWVTWKEGRVFYLDPGTGKRNHAHSYEGEAWGLAADATRLFLTDGSAFLTFRDGRSFEKKGRVQVRKEDSPVSGLNELEYVHGNIFANRYLTDEIVRIEPRSGCVTGVLDLEQLVSPELRQEWKDRYGVASTVLNGIAYDPGRGLFYVTGKNWPFLFLIRLMEP